MKNLNNIKNNQSPIEPMEYMIKNEAIKKWVRLWADFDYFTDSDVAFVNAILELEKKAETLDQENRYIEMGKKLEAMLNDGFIVSRSTELNLLVAEDKLKFNVVLFNFNEILLYRLDKESE